MREQVLAFIDAFRDMRHGFLNGKCYWFAVILNNRFPGSVIKYNQVDGHWATLIENHLYDASGEIDSKGFEDWPIVEEIGSSFYRGLLRDCINFWG